ncbi:MAG: septal ring lytic transglycosylase RlpA family protein [Terriglobia bacterium]
MAVDNLNGVGRWSGHDKLATVGAGVTAKAILVRRWLNTGEGPCCMFLRVVPLLATVLLSGCIRHHRRRVNARVPSAPAIYNPNPRELKGVASWYGYPYQGRPTASGEIYNMYALTAAHRTLPFGTMVRVHNLQNGKTVDVRINDRGPFIRGRIIDLSYSAAKAVSMVGPGYARVELEILNPSVVSGPEAMPGIYAVQVGAFRDSGNAQSLKAAIEPHFGPVAVQAYDSPAQGHLYRVRVGQLNNEGTANQLAGDITRAGLAAHTYVVRLN